MHWECLAQPRAATYLMPGRGRNQATPFSNRIPTHRLSVLVTTRFSSLLMASRIGLFTMLIPLQAKGAENIVRHGPSLSPGTLTVLPTWACRLESAWKFPGHSDLLNRCAVKNRTRGSNPLFRPNSLHPGEILAKSPLILAEAAVIRPFGSKLNWRATPLDFNLPAFYVFFLWTSWQRFSTWQMLARYGGLKIPFRVSAPNSALRS